MVRFDNFLLAAGALLLSGSLVQAQPQYEFRQIDYPNAASTYVGGINANGVVVGRYDEPNGRYHGFKLTDGVFTTIDCPSVYGEGGQAEGINDTGQIVGSCIRGSYNGDAFVLNQSGMTTFHFGGGPLTGAVGINNTGQIVGSYYTSAMSQFGYVKNGSTFTLISPPGAVSAVANGINNLSDIVGGYAPGGYSYLLLAGGSSYQVIAHPNFPITSAYGVNSARQIVGDVTDTSGHSRGFVHCGATFAAVTYPGASETWPRGVNDAGQIVGQFADNAGQRHGFIATPTGGYTVDILFDNTRAFKAGSTVPLKVQVRDAACRNASSNSLIVHTTSVALTGGATAMSVQDAGNANPDNDFRFSVGIGDSGGYIFNLNTKGLTIGAYELRLTIGSAPTTYSVAFELQ